MNSIPNDANSKPSASQIDAELASCHRVVTGGDYTERFLRRQEAEQDAKLKALELFKRGGIVGFRKLRRRCEKFFALGLERKNRTKEKHETTMPDGAADSILNRSHPYATTVEQELIAAEELPKQKLTEARRARLRRDGCRKLLSVLNDLERRVFAARLEIYPNAFFDVIADPLRDDPDEADPGLQCYEVIAKTLDIKASYAMVLFSRAAEKIRTRGYPLLTPDEREACEVDERTQGGNHETESSR